MSIVKAINELSGKEAVTIEDAIRNVELGGGNGDVVVVKGLVTGTIEDDSVGPTVYCQMEGEEHAGERYNEIVGYAEQGKLCFIIINAYMKDGALDPTGTGTLAQSYTLYPYNSSQWGTIAHDVQLEGSTHLWALREINLTHADNIN